MKDDKKNDKDNKLALTVVVSGDEVQVSINMNAPLRTLIPQALHEARHEGQPPEQWELRDAQGNELPLDRKIGEFGFTERTKIFMNLKAGVTGGYRATS
jgi:hypothetical protein